MSNGLLEFDLYEYMRNDAHVITLDELLELEEQRIAAMQYDVREYPLEEFEHVTLGDEDNGND